MTQRNNVDKNISKDKEKSFDIMWKYEISGYRYSQKNYNMFKYTQLEYIIMPNRKQGLIQDPCVTHSCSQWGWTRSIT